MSTLIINHSTNHTVEQALANDYSGIPIEEQVKSEANSFVRCTKEGRKFGLGMVAITQRSSAISEEIRTQAENFFTLYGGNTE